MEGGLIYSGSGKGYRNKRPAGLTGFVKSMNTSLKISLGICVSFFIILVGILLMLSICKIIELLKRIATSQHILAIHNNNAPSKLAPRKFSAREISWATDYFYDGRIIGRGGKGIVYRGVLQDKSVVSIKKFKLDVPSRIVSKIFVNEVTILSQIKHRHIVRLLGYCADLGGETLVCEFINNGTLYEHIHGKSKGSSTLSFQMRMKIAVEISAALEYLHSSSSTSKNISIVHLNVNSKRILLDKNYRARLANFREAKVIPQDQTQIQGTLRGLAGYLDPESKKSKKLSTKNDVYSFGVVLVELLTSQKAFCGEKPKGQRGLAKLFARSVEEGRWDQILDGKIIKAENLETAKKVVDLAKSCLGLQNERPSMREVAMKLEVMAWDYSAAKGLAKLNFSPFPKETDELLGSPSNAQLLHVRREHDEYFGRAELYYNGSLQNQIEINVELV
ncbi:Hypothetical predicted protein [Prunus dulcis]|uniref:Protein kinase domain-containing protein n=1 Tax=Prunus dulcis TaxID=3755 RepID=A0A5E4EBT3_PRUDU|nr:wall-associated receptor kinase 1-like [Prunus dulcis]KAI5346249.1 hypothetical protein L3X38_014128 [Prunus dulcis]VVA12350.1 Hypothetical predicted protein [Prunus dulcis]